MLLVGKNIRLRPLESEEDLRYLLSSFNDHEANGNYTRFEPRSWDEFQKFLKEASGPPAQMTIFLIEKIEEKKPIGSIAHFFASPYYKNMEIGYGIDKPSDRRRGYGFESVRLMLEYLFLTRNLERIQATTSVENLPSQSLLEKAGFKKEGVLRSADFVNGRYVDIIVYSMLRGEWTSTHLGPS